MYTDAPVDYNLVAEGQNMWTLIKSFGGLAIPPWARWAALVAMIAALFLSGVGYGYRWKTDIDERAAAKQEAANLATMQALWRAGALESRLYQTNLAKLAAKKATTKQEIPTHVTPQAVAACPLTLGTLWVLDNAASEALLPAPSGGLNDASSPTKLDALTEVVAGNYNDCQANAEQLKRLQAYVRTTQEKMEPTEK